ncbi:30S ribosomal protein S5 [archaeon]|nr:30S ribosomal protein S5 [archaeon]|tara:strand:+ start:3711 stop:4433 length:723 start_codon:yes stop_codon:yes gene_type:complete
MARKDDAPRGVAMEKEFDKEAWIPKTDLGKKIKSGEFKTIDEVIKSGKKILESEISDYLIEDLSSEIIAIGQSKGKFGGGKKSIWRQTQKKTSEGNKPKFATLVAVGNNDGLIGIGTGKSKETMPAKEKALRNAKLNVKKIKRGCGSWSCYCGKSHSIPFTVIGKCSSTIVKLMPAPKGTGLMIDSEPQKILKLAGITDVYSDSKNTTTKINLMNALFDALKKLSKTKVNEEFSKKAGIV